MNYVLILFSIFILFALIIPIYLKLKEQKKKTLSILVKASGTSLGILFAIAGIVKHSDKLSILIFIGIIFGLLGDVLLELYLPLGGFAFFLGNILYISSMISIERPRTIHYFIFFLFIVFFALSFGKDFQSFGKYRYLLLPYALIVAFMASMSIPFILLQGIDGMYLGFGTFLFAVSDYLLAYRILYSTKKEFHKISLGVYYLSQLLIGISIFMK